MTTTNVYSGMNLNKPTSKVLAPPGGQSNITFGGYGAEEPRQPRNQAAQQSAPPAAAQQQQQDYSPAKSVKPQNAAGQTQANIWGAGDPTYLPKPSSGRRRGNYGESSSSAGFNLLTGEPEAPKAQSNQQRNKAQERVDPINMSAAGGRLEERQVTRKNPPGGFSSLSFGNN